MMKSTLVYRGSVKFLILGVIFVVLTAIMTSFLFFSPGDAFASRADELRAKIENRNESIKNLEEDIAEYEQKLEGISQKSATLENAIASLSTNVSRVQAKVQLTKNKIEAAELELEKIQLEIDQKRQKIVKNKQMLAENIRSIDQREAATLVEILLKNDDISEFWEKLDTLSQFQKGLEAEIEKLRTLQKSIEEKEVLAKSKKADLLGYQTKLLSERNTLANTKQQKSSLLEQTQNKESAYQNLLAQKRARKKEFQGQLDALESKLQVVLDPTLLPDKGSSVLSWPTKSHLITQHFGVTSASGRLYASGAHNGLDIGVPMGTPVHAAADGVVKGARNTDLVCRGASYGRFVFIKHGNGLATISGHLSTILVHKGEQVTRGQLIGYSGASGYVTGPHLHFGVYAKQAVKMAELHSSACPGATYHIPIAPHNGYLAPLEYLP